MTNVAIFKRPVDPDVVAYLKDMLARAESGDVTGVLVVAQEGEGVTYTIAGIRDRMTVLGYLSHAMHKLQSD